jgi:hypothetical protein
MLYAMAGDPRSALGRVSVVQHAGRRHRPDGGADAAAAMFGDAILGLMAEVDRWRSASFVGLRRYLVRAPPRRATVRR